MPSARSALLPSLCWLLADVGRLRIPRASDAAGGTTGTLRSRSFLPRQQSEGVMLQGLTTMVWPYEPRVRLLLCAGCLRQSLITHTHVVGILSLLAFFVPMSCEHEGQENTNIPIYEVQMTPPYLYTRVITSTGAHCSPTCSPSAPLQTAGLSQREPGSPPSPAPPLPGRAGVGRPHLPPPPRRDELHAEHPARPLTARGGGA